MGGDGSGKPKAALLKLDGTQIDTYGNVTETDFFKFLQIPAEHAANLEMTMTPEQALKFRNHLISMKVGTSAAIPIVCGGAICMNTSCHFHEGKNWPIGQKCINEVSLIATWMKGYVDSLNVDPQDRSELVLVNQLVECDIIDYRANIVLSTDQEAWSLLKTTITTVGDGVTNEIMTPHPILEVKEKVQNRRLKVLEALAATRKEKKKRITALGDLNTDHGNHWANLKAAVQAVSSANTSPASSLDEFSAEIENADWEEIDND